MTDTILVIGGAGRTGRHIVAALHRRERAVRVLSRRGTPPRMGSRAGEVVRGDITDAVSVRAAMAGVAGVVVVVESADTDDAPNAPERVHYNGARNVLAAAAPGVHVVLVSQIYITRPDRYPEVRNVILWRDRAEEAVRAGGVPYTIVRPSWLSDDPGGRSALRLDQGDRGEGRVARADVAEVCIRALLTPAARGKTFEVYGGPGTPPGEADWPALFAALAPDRPLEGRP